MENVHKSRVFIYKAVYNIIVIIYIITSFYSF